MRVQDDVTVQVVWPLCRAQAWQSMPLLVFEPSALCAAYGASGACTIAVSSAAVLLLHLRLLTGQQTCTER